MSNSNSIFDDIAKFVVGIVIIYLAFWMLGNLFGSKTEDKKTNGGAGSGYGPQYPNDSSGLQVEAEINEYNEGVLESRKYENVDTYPVDNDYENEKIINAGEAIFEAERDKQESYYDSLRQHEEEQKSYSEMP